MNKKMLNKWLCLVLIALITNISAFAQTIKVQGNVSDDKGEALIGVSIQVKGSTVGTQSDLDGNFEIEAQKDAILIFSYLGFDNKEINLKDTKLPIKVTLSESTAYLNDVVVIGYGTVKKKDLTGSISSISSESFQKGMISTPDQLISGKLAGVQITQNGGAPGAGSRIRIRGGASLNASNDPLIIIDDVPMDNNLTPGTPSILSSINPDDIESINILKDASATAIYGSRASNGVIIITTKKGKLGQNLRINFSTQFTTSTPIKYLDVMNAEELKEAVTKHDNTENKKYVKMLGSSNTNWQKQIYKTAFGTDNNLSISGATSWLPYRASLGFFKQDGILLTDNMQRVSGSINLNPRFFKGDLIFNINVSGANIQNRFSNKEAIYAAVQMDPTQAIKDEKFKKYGGYFTWISSDVPNKLAPYNPVAQLLSTSDRSNVYTSVGSFKVDYRPRFFKDLKLTMNLGYDFSSSKGRTYMPIWAPQTYTNQKAGKGGLDKHFEHKKINTLLDIYANYTTSFDFLQSNLDVLAGYSYQDWKQYITNFAEKTAGGIEYDKPNFPYNYPQHTLVSFYSRINYNIMDKYLLTATLRTDGSSRFAPKHRWGFFPSMAFAWKIKQEDFLKDVKAVSDLKLRLGYGVTGQQDGIADYSYLPVYYLSGATLQYQLGDKFYNMYKPLAYDKTIKWEQTATYNAGLDFGFLEDRITGTVDFYYKDTKDLLNNVPIPAGSNFSNRILTNVGRIINKGLELSFNFVPIQTKDWNWNISTNFTINDTKITKLNLSDDKDFLGVLTGGIKGLTGSNIQIHSIGYAPNTFFVYQQVYDKNGKAIEGLYADRNNDGIINEYDKYHFHNPEATCFMGLSSSLSYKNLSVSTSLRANIGNYVYDNISSRLANYASSLNNDYVANLPRSIAETNFNRAQYESDFYIRNASFIKMDNLSIAYDFGKIIKNKIGVQLIGTIQNVFTITKYKGIDPEIAGGRDNNIYPIPRIYSLKLNLNF